MNTTYRNSHQRPCGSGLVLPLFVLLLSIAWFAEASESLPAFPGAEGFGAVSVGGRHGKVIRVTNLNADGPGSLQAAASASGPRIVVFDVAGVIRGDLQIKHPNITIAGESAPSPGITLVGRIVARPQEGQRLRDIVIRFLRIRQKPVRGHTGDVIQLPKSERIILDHLSLAWGNDELIDIIHSSEVTVQWCTLEESDPTGHSKGEAHNFALLSAYPLSGNISIHHNLFAHNSKRNPSLSPYVENKPADFRNNVIYNFKQGLGHDGHKPAAGINLIENYYKRGPNSERIQLFEFSGRGKYFLKGNQLADFGPVNRPGDVGFFSSFHIGVSREGELQENEFPVATVQTDDAVTAYLKVLALAGSFPRDRVTRRTIREVITGTGSWRRGGPAEPDDDWFLSGIGQQSKPEDRDGDGMPDQWEQQKGLDPDRESANQLMANGYTAIEVYLHERAEALIKGPRQRGAIELAID
ncbi:MAG: pectate lyase precursor [Candidatus Thiodiazotropha taylori]|nr:pectate lyase precursor [Candidatus Thiodiazotropha taylori]